MLMRPLFLCLLWFTPLASGATDPAPSARDSWWWDERWWSEGVFPGSTANAVIERKTSYTSGDAEVPVRIFRPKARGNWPAVMFVHGRRGLDELTALHARRLAAQGFFVFAPDLFTGRFIAPFPYAHDYALETDLGKGLDLMLAQPEAKGRKICTVGISRGGYYTLKLAVSQGRQKKELACYVGYYPHLQDPNAPEPLQVYQYAPEVNEFTLPVLILVGEQEQYHRRRLIEAAVDTWRTRKLEPRYIVYPGIGRGFDFRPDNVRTFADDLASKDAMLRVAAFLRRHLADR